MFIRPSSFIISLSNFQRLQISGKNCNFVIRWAFNAGQWSPTETEWCRAIQMIQPEEKQRIEQFRYQTDMKSSLAGRLLLRSFAVSVLGVDNHCVEFTRSDRGKPVLKTGDGGWDYNVSHAGDWVVLAAGQVDMIGVDVMKTSDSRVTRLEEFFRIMRRQFTDQEWININNAGDEEDQLSRFFRHWTLKESYVKAVGTGLNIDLRRLNFKLNEESLNQDDVVSSTKLEVDGDVTDWRFEESVLDEEHVVSVAVINKQDCDNQEPFEKLDLDEIFSIFTSQSKNQDISSQLLRPLDLNDYQLFSSKDHPKPF